MYSHDRSRRHYIPSFYLGYVIGTVRADFAIVARYWRDNLYIYVDWMQSKATVSRSKRRSLTISSNSIKHGQRQEVYTEQLICSLHIQIHFYSDWLTGIELSNFKICISKKDVNRENIFWIKSIFIHQLF